MKNRKPHPDAIKVSLDKIDMDYIFDWPRLGKKQNEKDLVFAEGFFHIGWFIPRRFNKRE